MIDLSIVRRQIADAKDIFDNISDFINSEAMKHSKYIQYVATGFYQY